MDREEANARYRATLLVAYEGEMRTAYWNAIANGMKDPVVLLIDVTDRDGRALLDAMAINPGKPAKGNIRMGVIPVPYGLALEVIGDAWPGGHDAMERARKRERQIQYIVVARRGRIFGSMGEQMPAGGMLRDILMKE